MGSAGSLRCLSAPLLVLVVYWCSIFLTFLVLSPNGRFGNRKKTAKVVEFRPLFISIKFLLFFVGSIWDQNVEMAHFLRRIVSDSEAYPVLPPGVAFNSVG